MSDALLDFICPRCGQAASETFFGPCGACRVELVATIRRDAVVIEVDAYEPKSHVVPNQVATKE